MPVTKTRYPKWVKSYVLKLQEELRLAHWTIEFGTTYCSDTSLAEIQISPAQHHAILTLSNEWRTWSRIAMRSTLAHELMHCHINPINELAEEHLDDLSPKTAGERKMGLNYVNERVTDAIAEMVAPHLTLPRIPKRADSKSLSHTLAHSRTLKSNKKGGRKGKKGNKSVKNTRSGGKRKPSKRR
jgi:hypothetical protein